MRKLKSLLVVLLLTATGIGQTWQTGLAQDPDPEQPAETVEPGYTPDALVKEPEREYVLAEPQLIEQPEAGVDSFGYRWADNAADPTKLYSWIDAKGSGTQISLRNPDDAYSDPIAIGFSFKFYEYTYTTLYAATNGLISFGAGTISSTNAPLGKDPSPNNLIAPLWDDLQLGGGGGMYILRGADAVRGKYLVVEWNNVSRISDPTTHFTFQAVLYQNGDIKFQYQTLGAAVDSASVGIEDADGLVGLQYLYNSSGLVPQRAVLFTRPPADVRVKLLARHFGGFVTARRASTLLKVRNTGEMGADTYNLMVNNLSSPGWRISFADAASQAALGDTNRDGMVDTGAVAQGETFTFTLNIEAPDDVSEGEFADFTLSARSSLNAAKQQSMTLLFAVPVSFSQFYADSESGIGLEEISAARRKTLITDPWFSGSSIALGSQSTGGLVGIWEQNDIDPIISPLAQTSLKFAWVDPNGELVRTQAPLTNNMIAGHKYWMALDESIGLAVGENGATGAVWLRSITDFDPTSPNSLGVLRNVYFNWIEANGEKGLAQELNLTNSTAWVRSDDLNQAEYDTPRIASMGSGRYWISWRVETRLSDGVSVTSIYGGVYSSSGAVIKAPVMLASSTSGQTIFKDLNLVPLSGGRVLVLFSENNVATGNYRVMAMAFNASGAKVFGLNAIPGATGWRADAAQLGSGNILLAWTHTTGGKGDGLRYTILNGATFAPLLASPVEFMSQVDHAQDNLSVILEPDGKGVITWMDVEGGDYLFYALVGENGDLITPPMIFYPQFMKDSTVLTNQSGQGNAFYDPSFKLFLPVTRR